MNIVLIGYRGSGKTTIGRRLADQLWMSFVDTDVLIIQRAGKTIKEIFEQQGEAAFRELEVQVIAEVMTRDNQVIAAGGGAVLREENLRAFKKNARVIWLQADPEVLHQRIAADAATATARPNLTPNGGLGEVRSVLAARQAAYQAAADVTLDVTRLNVQDATWHLTRLI